MEVGPPNFWADGRAPADEHSQEDGSRGKWQAYFRCSLPYVYLLCSIPLLLFFSLYSLS